MGPQKCVDRFSTEDKPSEGSGDAADDKPKEGEAAPDTAKKEEGDAEGPKDTGDDAAKAELPKPSKRWDALNTGRSTIRGKPEYRDRDGVINDDRDDRGFGSRFGGRDPRDRHDRRGGYDSRPPYDDGGRGDGGRGGYDDRYGGRRDYDGRDRYGGRRDPYDDRDRGYSRFDRDDRGGYGGDRFGPPRGRYEDRGRFGGDRYGDRRRDPRDDRRDPRDDRRDPRDDRGTARGTTSRGIRGRHTCAASGTGDPVVIIALVTRRAGSHKRRPETCRAR